MRDHTPLQFRRSRGSVPSGLLAFRSDEQSGRGSRASTPVVLMTFISLDNAFRGGLRYWHYPLAGYPGIVLFRYALPGPFH